MRFSVYVPLLVNGSDVIYLKTINPSSATPAESLQRLFLANTNDVAVTSLTDTASTMSHVADAASAINLVTSTASTMHDVAADAIDTIKGNRSTNSVSSEGLDLLADHVSSSCFDHSSAAMAEEQGGNQYTQIDQYPVSEASQV